ncbi:MAG: hypothetical protein QW321_01970 [Candidatus Aenigmatarchaeota archaeon]
MEKVEFELEEDIYEKARSLKGKIFSSFSELVRTSIKELYEKTIGEWPPRKESVYDYILRKRLRELKKP